MFSFNFYFTDTNIMGSVADWVMVLVTAGTGLLLWLTLRTQLEMSRIEKFRHRDSIKPVFSLDVETFGDNSRDEEEPHLMVKFSIKLTENNAFNIKCKPVYTKPWIIIYKTHNKESMSRGDSFSLIGRLNIERNDNESLYMGQLELNLNYQDAEGRLYTQDIMYHNFNGNHHRTIDLPKYSGIQIPIE